MKKRVVVVGAGIIGLTSAIRLHQRGFAVEIISRDPPLATTSAVAAAMWYPYRVSPIESAKPWAISTYAEYKAQIRDKTPGLSMSRLQLVYQTDPGEPWWKDTVDEFRFLPANEVPGDFRAAIKCRVPLADTSIYLPWLIAQLDLLSIPLTIRALNSLSELAHDCDMVVNCCGVWARELVGDAEIFPIRGQVRLTAPLASHDSDIMFFPDDSYATYVIPRSSDCLLGGTAEEGEWNTTPSDTAARDIQIRCEKLDPRVVGLNVLSDRAGLRPGRDEVRLEMQDKAEFGMPVIHNYGHGGSGFTLAWGCAEQVAAMVLSRLI